MVLSTSYNPLKWRIYYLIFTVQVQVDRLGRSRKLYMSADEDTSTSCVVKATMPPDSTRWWAI